MGFHEKSQGKLWPSAKSQENDLCPKSTYKDYIRNHPRFKKS